jgi:dephospho-CoA kinase
MRLLDQFLFKAEDVVVLEAPLLFESGLNLICDIIVSVSCPEEQRLQRLLWRDCCSPDEARSRIHSQLAQEVKDARANGNLCIVAPEYTDIK